VVGVAQLIVVQLDQPGNGILYSLLLWVLQNITYLSTTEGKMGKKACPWFWRLSNFCEQVVVDWYLSIECSRHNS
jgi:hypothetical protein